ncbi:MAG: dual OB domain-containing protein [Paludibacteraceae bacterium]
MDKYFLCLANSYKHENRCVAGVEVYKTNDGFILKKDTWNLPTWFRPINKSTDAGAIPNEEAVKISLFDVVMATMVEGCPDCAQTENHYYEELIVVGRMSVTSDLLADVSHTNRRVLLGNVSSFITHDYYLRMNYSIFMIQARDVSCYLKERNGKHPQPRMRFSYKDNKYDFPITDPDFRHLMEHDLQKANSYLNYYLTLSLSLEFNGQHFKLISGVITE